MKKIPAAQLLMLSVSLTVLVAIVWMSMARIDVGVQGHGEVLPEGDRQYVQSFDGGIVVDIEVEEGDVVRKGDVLVRLDSAQLSLRVEELDSQIEAAAADIKRMQYWLQVLAEGRFTSAVDDLDGWVALNASEVNQKQLLAEQIKSMVSSQEGIDLNISQRRTLVSQSKQTLKLLEEKQRLLESEIKVTRPLVQRQSVPETDLLALQRELLNAQQEHQVVLGQISTAESEILGLGNDKLVLINSSMTDTRELLLKKLSERQSFLQSKDLLENQLLRSTLVAPVNGIVNRLNNKSLGATVLPGDVVVELVPTDDGIFVEAGIAPRDIAFAQVSQEVRVSVSAYDAAEFGTLSGTVTWIASDTYLNAEGQALYRVHIRLDDSFVGADNQELPLLPGMEASVDVLTNRQSILAYLLKPVRRAFNDALKES